jgi:phage terminase large subunit GpA-like protein
VDDAAGEVALLERLGLDRAPALEFGRSFARAILPPRMRTMRQFAEEEIVLPNGPHVGESFRTEYQPVAGLWFDAIDSGRWNEFAYTGPTQFGKSLIAEIIPTLYHLFEIGETVIAGVPDLNMAGDKWREDFLPVIERTQYARHLPRTGRGSRGAERVEYIAFENGATLRFMAGGGGDAQRKSYTGRVLVVTEADSLDTAGATSVEASKMRQLRGRTRAFGELTGQPPIIYSECTVTVEKGYIWQTVQKGTNSRIELPCPHCGAWVTLERGDLIGWQAAESELEVRSNATFRCSACQTPWSDEERIAANRRARLTHTNPESLVLGFRASAVNNCFVSAREIALGEWKASRAADEVDANRDQCQQVWAVPPPEASVDLTVLEFQAVARRVAEVPRGVVPAGSAGLVLGLDLGMRLADWTLLSFDESAGPHVVDYGALDVRSHELGLEAALAGVLHDAAALCEQGWPDAQGVVRRPVAVGIDSGWGDSTAVVYAFVREMATVGTIDWLALKGFGFSQGRRYTRPRTVSNLIVQIGEGYHLVQLADAGVLLLEFDADQWKSWLHQRIKTPLGEPGALTLYQAPPRDHYAWAKQVTAERQIEEFVAGKGMMVRWENTLRRPNHYLDAAVMACVMGHLVGIRMVAAAWRPEPAAAPAPRPRVERPGGRGWLPR